MAVPSLPGLNAPLLSAPPPDPNAPAAAPLPIDPGASVPPWLALAAGLPPIPGLAAAPPAIAPPVAALGPQLPDPNAGARPPPPPPPPAIAAPPTPTPIGGAAAVGPGFSAPPAIQPPDGAHAGMLAPQPIPGAPGSPVLGPAPLTVAQLTQTGDLATVRNEQPYEFDPWANPNDAQRDDAARQLALADPVKFVAYQQHLVEQKQSEGAAAAAKLAHDDMIQQQQNYTDLKAANAIAQQKDNAINQDALTLAARHPDRTRWFQNLGTLGTIGAVGSILIGGLLSPTTGGRNTGMEFVTNQIDRDIDEQKADIENQRESLKTRQGIVAQEYQRTGDLYHAAEVARTAAYQGAIAQLQAQQQDYDPHGTSFAAIGQGIQQLAGAQQAQQDKRQKELTDRTLATIKESRETAAQQEIARHNRQEEGLGWAKQSLEARKDAADNALLTPAQIRQQYPKLPVEAIPPGPVTQKQLSAHVETYNKTLETGNKTTGNVTQTAGTQIIGADGKPLTQDGTPSSSPVVAARPEDATKLNEVVAGGQDVLTSLAKVKRFLQADPSSLDRSAWAAATTDLENAKFAFAKLHDTKASSRELEAMTKLFGDDYDGYIARVKDRSVGLGHIDAIINDSKTTVANELRRKAQYTGPSVLVDTSNVAPPEETDEDRDLKTLLATPQQGEGVTPARIAAIPGAKVGDESQYAASPKYQPEGYSADAYSSGGDYTPSGVTLKQERILDKLEAAIADPDPDTRNRWTVDLARPAGDRYRDKAEKEVKEAEQRRNTALEALTRTANSANNRGVQWAASRLLQSVVQPGAAPGEPEQVR